MSAWWLVAAFVGGMAFMWKVAGRIVWYALGKRSLILEDSLKKLDYDNVVRMRAVVDRELARRLPPPEPGPSA